MLSNNSKDRHPTFTPTGWGPNAGAAGATNISPLRGEDLSPGRRVLQTFHPGVRRTCRWDGRCYKHFTLTG